MMKWMLAAGAAALAIATPALSDPGKNESGKGGDRKAAKVDRGGGGGDRGQKAREQRFERASKTQEQRFERASKAGEQRFEQGKKIREQRFEQAKKADEKRFERGKKRNEQIFESQKRFAQQREKAFEERNKRLEKIAERGRDFDDDRVFRVRDFDRRGEVRFRDVDRDDLFVRQLGYGNGGCPPGLAKKSVACMPPGQAAKLVGQPLLAASRLAALNPLPLSMRSLFLDDDDYYYRWGGGYMYRVDRDNDLISSMIPLFGAALLGQPLQPAYLNNYYRPSYFNAFYPNSPYDCYDYGYGYVYERDCASGLVEDVIPTYDYGYGVGQMLPASYGYYNVPFAYRSHFNDNDDYYYRYAPGAIYQVDRDTALIQAVVALLTGGLSVGQQLPVGYNAYNVPLAYRSTYYDTPDTWYRYDDGYIYAVDPGSRMVRNVAYVIV